MCLDLPFVNAGVGRELYLSPLVSHATGGSYMSAEYFDRTGIVESDNGSRDQSGNVRATLAPTVAKMLVEKTWRLAPFAIWWKGSRYDLPRTAIL